MGYTIIGECPCCYGDLYLMYSANRRRYVKCGNEYCSAERGVTKDVEDTKDHFPFSYPVPKSKTSKTFEQNKYMDLSFSENKLERKLGLIFGLIWFAILIFYITWNGWIYEWMVCGYDGPNQYFSFEIFNLDYERVNGEIIYHSTNNLHNIIYLCYYSFAIGWMGLLFDSEKLKHAAMCCMAFPLMAAAATLDQAHIYIVQIVYNIVHASGVAIGVYLFYTVDLEVKKAKEGILATWVIYILSRIIMEPWPYWSENANAYFSVNQINDMPFYFYGLEYGIVIILLFGMNFGLQKINERFTERKWKALFPLAFFVVILIIFLALGLIETQYIEMTC